MNSARITVATREDRCVLENLLQLYTHDFSEQWAGSARGELEADGRFPAYPHLDAYWTDPARTPFLIRTDGALAGFALVNTFARSAPPVDAAMAEFFVVRKHRRSGVGLAALEQVFAHRPGAWEVAVARRNVAGLAFWTAALSASPGVAALERHDRPSETWDGPVFRFQVASSEIRS